MKNRHVREKLSEFIDGMLSEEEAAAVKEHLDLCVECMEEYEEMVKIIGHMNRMEPLEIPDSFVERVHERMEKPSAFQRLVKGLFVPIRIKVPLELAGVAAAALLVIYIVGIRGKQHVYELAYVQRSQPQALLQEQTLGTASELDETAPLPKKVESEQKLEKKKADPELEFEEEKGGKRDKRSVMKEAVAQEREDLSALKPAEKGIKKQAQIEDAVSGSKMVREEKERGFESQEETIEREGRVEVIAPSAARAQKREKPAPIIADKERREAKKEVLEELAPSKESLEEILVALGGKIIESKTNKDTQVLESLKIEFPADKYQTLIQILEDRGDIQKPLPIVKEKDQEIITILLIFKQ
jgi:hypothetical protein